MISVAWNTTTGGLHAVKFYERERPLYDTIASFLAEALGHGEPAIAVAGCHTFEAVSELLISEHGVAPEEVARCVRFAEVHAALGEFMDGLMPDPVRFARSFSDLIAEVRQGDPQRRVWLYGEGVDVLCKQGNHRAAQRVEELCNEVFGEDRVIILCGYAITDFDADANASHFRGVCGQHTHVIPTERFTDLPDERTRLAEVAFLQHRTRALGLGLAPEPPSGGAARTSLVNSTIYIVDDDASVRRSLARLLSSADMSVRTFDSAEAFFESVPSTARGCLIVDVQLGGLSGPELQGRMVASAWTMPIIAISGSFDLEIEAEALRRGARSFLRKPFDAETLFEAIARAMPTEGTS